MNEPLQAGRVLGVVQLRVGGRLYAVPVQALDFASDKDNKRAPSRGGFFVDHGTMGILVDDNMSEQQQHSQVMEGCAEAVRHLSTQFLN